MNDERLIITKKFKSLFELLNSNNYPDVDTVIITGGRNSYKSYTVAVFTLIALVQHHWNTLYTRYTSMSITDSVKPEITSKIDVLKFNGFVRDTQNQIEYENNRISFKGIKTGSQQQTASLKSLSNFNCFVNDEAEELPDYDTFKKVYYSVRSNTKRNLSILILNPTTKEHWIFQEFFAKKGLNGGDNCIIDNVMYIHTSYLDGEITYIPKNILKDYQKLKIENPEKYDNIVLGGWIQEPEGVLLPKTKLKFEDISKVSLDNVVFKVSFIDPADTGGDKYSMPFIWVAQYDNQLVCYVKDVLHNTTGVAANTQRAKQRLKDCLIEQLIIESNGLGLAAVLEMKREIKDTVRLSAIPSTVNKDVRILSNYEFVQQYFIFDSAYESNPEYKSFISDVTNYSKEGDNKHRKDAIDVLCNAADFIKKKYNKFLYG